MEGVPIAFLTMADAVGSVCAAFDPLLRLVEAHVMAAERLHGDDTTVPVLAEGKTDTGRCWVYRATMQPFWRSGAAGGDVHYPRDRRGEHPQAHLAGHPCILQADAYDGYNKLYLAGAQSWAHPGGGVLGARPASVLRHGRHRRERPAQSRRQEGDSLLSPIAIEIVRRIDALFAIERSINGKSAEERLSICAYTLSRPLVDDLHAYMSAQLARLARGPRPGQGDQLHSQAPARLHPVPRRWACLLLEQCRRTRTARYCSRQKILAVLRVGSGRPSGSCHVQSHCHGQDEWRRSPGLARQTFSPASPLTPPIDWMNCCRGTGRREPHSSPLMTSDHARQQSLSRQNHQPRRQGPWRRRGLALRRRHGDGAPKTA